MERNAFERSMVTCTPIKGLIDGNGDAGILRQRWWFDPARKREKGGAHELPGKEWDVTTDLAWLESGRRWPLAWRQRRSLRFLAKEQGEDVGELLIRLLPEGGVEGEVQV